MIINFNNKKLTDNTTEIKFADLFLLTTRNKKYFKKLKNNIEFIEVEDLIQGWGLDKIKFIGITGTNGKTTVATAITHILQKLNFIAGNQGTSGFFIGNKLIVEKKNTTPEILEILFNAKQALEKGAKFFVMEASSHAIEQNRIEGINFEVKVHTNITSDHLDYHQTVVEYRRVKNIFFNDKSKKVINIDDQFVKFNDDNVVTYSLKNILANFYVSEFSLENKLKFSLNYQHQNEKDFAVCESSLVGKFNIYNLVAAIATVKTLTQIKFTLQEISETLPDFQGMPGRMEVISIKPLIIVDFAHTADGIEKVLNAFENKKITLVFGAGGDRDNSKRSEMGAVAEKYAHKIYITSDNPRAENPEEIIQQIVVGIKNKEKVEIIIDRKKAIETALKNLNKNEILLVLGKGDETYQEINGQKFPFDDREIIRNFLL